MHRRLTALLLVLWLATGVRGAGLLAPTDTTLPALRVTDHLVTVTIDDQIGLTTVRQVFHNDTNRRLEATYVFPLPENADLTDFQMSFNGKMVQGEVLPAAEARQIYERIVRQTKDPGLIEFIGHRLLQMRVFPIEPNSDVTIQVKYQQICRPISGMSGYHYPLRTARTSGRAFGTVRFDVTLKTGAPLKTIWSPSHAVEVVRDGEHAARIAYEAKSASLEDDFLLLYDTDTSDLGLSTVAYRPDPTKPGHFVVTLTPKQLWPDDKAQPQDVVFVIDTSGSMAGEKLDQAKAALRWCIERLSDEDRFSVVRFSTGFDLLFDQLTTATRDHRKAAHEFVDRFSAAGGTNISDSLKAALGLHRDDDASRPFVVVFLTDGQGNRGPDEILRMVRETAGGMKNLRMFPFGVGTDVNTTLLDQLASAHTGRPVYVLPGENLEIVVGDFFSIISRPVLTNLALSMPGLSGVTERFPVALGDLYHGQQLIVAGQFAEAKPGPVKLTAQRAGTTVEFSWPSVSFAHTPEATYVPSIWAGRKIAYLVDEIRTVGEKPELLDELLALSAEYGIQTPYSSWLVTPEGRGGSIDRNIERLGRAGGGGGSRQLRTREALTADELRDASRGLSRGLSGGEARGKSIDLYHVAPAAAPVEAMKQVTGAAATEIAKKTAALRASITSDGDRLDRSRLVRQKHGDRWYVNVDGVLVDEAIGETAEIVIVAFGSDAYFDLANGRPELRKVLAASPLVMVKVTDGAAVMVIDHESPDAVSSFTAEQKAKFGL